MGGEGAALPPYHSSTKATNYTHDITASPACCYDNGPPVTLYGLVINTWSSLHLFAFQSRLLRDDHGWHHYRSLNYLMNGNHTLVEILHLLPTILLLHASAKVTAVPAMHAVCAGCPEASQYYTRISVVICA